jgi:lysine-specific demethylase/histidyl-hydroxylase NO66
MQVNLYLTPPEAQGLNLHYDTHDVFVLHLHGAKRWEVFEQAVEAPLAHQHGRVEARDVRERLLAETLKPGDALYLPRGFPHAATTDEAASAHLTIGVLALTWIDLLDEVVREAEGDPALRAALPPGFTRAPAEDLAAEVRVTLDRVAQRLARADAAALAERLQRRASRRFPPAPAGQLQRLLALDAVRDESFVRPLPEVATRVRTADAQVILELADRSIAMPARVAPALGALLAPDGVEVSELGRWLDAHGRLVLVRRLIREGVLEAAVPP